MFSFEIDVKGGGCVFGVLSVVVGNGVGVVWYGYWSKGFFENGGVGRCGRGCNCCCYGSWDCLCIWIGEFFVEWGELWYGLGLMCEVGVGKVFF